LNLENLGSYRRVHFLLISDGLSNVGDPIPVAQKCYELDIDVNTILIDPTPEGEKIARQISIDGRVTSVTSSLQLASAVEKEREPVEQDARMAASNRVLTQITLITALFAFFATALGFVNGVLKQPVEMLIFLAVIAILGAGFLMWYVGFAKYLPKIYVPNPQKIPKYTKKTRVFSFVSSALLIILGMTFLYIAFLNLKSTASSYDNTKNLLTIYWNFKK